MMRAVLKFVTSLLCSLLLIKTSNGLFADSVYLKDGSILHGQIRAMDLAQTKDQAKAEDQALTFKLKHGGEVGISWDSVIGINIDQARYVQFQSGVWQEGTLTYQASSDITDEANKRQWQFQSRDNKLKAIQAQDIKRIAALSDNAQSVKAIPESHLKITTKATTIGSSPSGEIGPGSNSKGTDPKGTNKKGGTSNVKGQSAKDPKPAKWEVKLAAGMNGETGTNELVNFNTTFNAKRTSHSGNTLRMYGRGRFSQRDSETNAKEIIGGVQYDFKIFKDFSTFIKEEVEHDRFENIHFRSTTTTGVAYDIFNRQTFEYAVKFGAGAEYEEQMGGIQETNSVIEVGQTIEYQFKPFLTFEHEFELIPEMEHFGDDYRANMENGVKIPLKKDSWNIQVGMRNSYNKRQTGNREKLNTYYFTRLVWELK